MHAYPGPGTVLCIFARQQSKQKSHVARQPGFLGLASITALVLVLLTLTGSVWLHLPTGTLFGPSDWARATLPTPQSLDSETRALLGGSVRERGWAAGLTLDGRLWRRAEATEARFGDMSILMSACHWPVRTVRGFPEPVCISGHC
jgi:hypothetical protein